MYTHTSIQTFVYKRERCIIHQSLDFTTTIHRFKQCNSQVNIRNLCNCFQFTCWSKRKCIGSKTVLSICLIFIVLALCAQSTRHSQNKCVTMETKARTPHADTTWSNYSIMNVILLQDVLSHRYNSHYTELRNKVNSRTKRGNIYFIYLYSFSLTRW